MDTTIYLDLGCANFLSCVDKSDARPQLFGTGRCVSTRHNPIGKVCSSTPASLWDCDGRSSYGNSAVSVRKGSSEGSLRSHHVVSRTVRHIDSKISHTRARSYRTYFRRKPFKSPVHYPKRIGLQIGRVTDLNLRDYCKDGTVR